VKKSTSLKWSAALVLALAAGLPSAPANAAPKSAAAAKQWSYFGGSHKFDRYSPLTKIDASNVGKLEVLWTRDAVDQSLRDAFPDVQPSEYLRGTPIMVDGVLYSSNGIGLVEAFDAATGATKWVQQPFAATLKEAAGVSSRGVEYWRKGDEERIFSVRGEYIYAMDAKTGKLVESFGDKGRTSLNRNTPDSAPFFGFNGPIIVADVIVIGGNGGGKAGGGYGDGGPTKESTPENIRGYDAVTGKLLWTFDILPKPGTPGAETWKDGSGAYVGNMGAWAPLAADDETGLVYVPLTAPTNSYYGGHRPGDNLYADSLVVLDAKTGKLAWHYQMVHHDVWDYDNASPPTLGDIKVGGKTIKAVIQPNKTGFLFVFDRKTGKPVWPIDERPVSTSSVPGEHLSPTQPFPSKPEPFDRQGLTEDDLIDFTPEIRAEAKAYADQYHYGPLFTAPSVLDEREGGKKGSLLVPGAWGSGNWNMGAFDPETGYYYAISHVLPGTMALGKPTEEGATIGYEGIYRRTPGAAPQARPYGAAPGDLPLLKPPYGRIVAYDMNKGEKLWTVANGDGPRNHPRLKDLNLPPLGTPGRPVPLLTGSLLFLGEASDALFGNAGVGGPSTFRAYDKKSGAVIWQTTLPAGTTGGPVTYEVGGKQIIVVPVGDKKAGARWIALGIK